MGNGSQPEKEGIISSSSDPTSANHATSHEGFKTVLRRRPPRGHRSGTPPPSSLSPRQSISRQSLQRHSASAATLQPNPASSLGKRANSTSNLHDNHSAGSSPDAYPPQSSFSAQPSNTYHPIPYSVAQDEQPIQYGTSATSQESPLLMGGLQFTASPIGLATIQDSDDDAGDGAGYQSLPAAFHSAVAHAAAASAETHSTDLRDSSGTWLHTLPPSTSPSLAITGPSPMTSTPQPLVQPRGSAGSSGEFLLPIRSASARHTAVMHGVSHPWPSMPHTPATHRQSAPTADLNMPTPTVFHTGNASQPPVANGAGGLLYVNTPQPQWTVTDASQHVYGSPNGHTQGYSSHSFGHALTSSQAAVAVASASAGGVGSTGGPSSSPGHRPFLPSTRSKDVSSASDGGIHVHPGITATTSVTTITATNSGVHNAQTMGGAQYSPGQTLHVPSHANHNHHQTSPHAGAGTTPLASQGVTRTPATSGTHALAPHGGGSGAPPPAAGPSGGAALDEDLQTFFEYLRGEASPVPKLPTADVVWGQTERDRVYNFLLYVPYQLERLIQFGTLLCFDSLLAVVTVMPCRAMAAVVQVMGRRVAGAASKAGITAKQQQPAAPPATAAGAAAAGVPAGASAGAAASVGVTATTLGMSKARAPGLAGNQVYDILCLFLVLTCTAVLRAVKPGFIYYWLKDITSEFLKMSVLSAAFEITDKILSNFGMDVMEALSGTCTLWVAGRRSTLQLTSDLFVAWGITITHALTLMCEGLVLAVALNSRRHGLLALLIANNFVEIKGAVFKRWDVPRIWGLVCQDIVERLHLWAVLFFVIVEDMESSASWRPSNLMLWESARILGAEVVIDVIKHAVLGKFNDVRPGIYREYMKDLCEKAVSSQSHSLNKLMGFQHLPTACLILRSISTLFWMDMPNTSQVWRRAVLLGLGWLLLLLLKPFLGYALKIQAHSYYSYYNRMYATKHTARPIRDHAAQLGRVHTAVAAAPVPLMHSTGTATAHLTSTGAVGSGGQGPGQVSGAPSTSGSAMATPPSAVTPTVSSTVSTMLAQALANGLVGYSTPQGGRVNGEVAAVPRTGAEGAVEANGVSGGGGTHGVAGKGVTISSSVGRKTNKSRGNGGGGAGSSQVVRRTASHPRQH